MGNLLLCHRGDHDGAVNRRKGRKEVEPRPLPLTGKQQQLTLPSDQQLGFLGAIGHRGPHLHQQHQHHFSPFGQYFHRYRRTKDTDGEKKKKERERKQASKPALKTSSLPPSDSQQGKFVSCSSFSHTAASTVFPSSFSKLNSNKQQQQQDHQNQQPPSLNRSLSLQQTAQPTTMSRKELPIRQRKYPPLPSVPGGRAPTLKVPLKMMTLKAASVPSYHRSVSLGCSPSASCSVAAVSVHSGRAATTSKASQSFKVSSNSNSMMTKKMTAGKMAPLTARRKQ